MSGEYRTKICIYSSISTLIVSEAVFLTSLFTSEWLKGNVENSTLTIGLWAVCRDGDCKSILSNVGGEYITHGRGWYILAMLLSVFGVMTSVVSVFSVIGYFIWPTIGIYTLVIKWLAATVSCVFCICLIYTLAGPGFMSDNYAQDVLHFGLSYTLAWTAWALEVMTCLLYGLAHYMKYRDRGLYYDYESLN